MKLKIRDSNYELLRIVSMIFIIIWHIIFHGDLLWNTIGVSKFVLDFVLIFVVFHVNSFVLIMGYYQSQTKFKLKKLIALLLEVAFYNFVINFILKETNLISYTNIEYINQISFYNLTAFWFFSCYIITYLLSPFLNKIIDKFDKTTLKKLIITLLIAFCLIPFFTGNLMYYSDGYGVAHFILLYFIGAYINKYDINKTLFSDKNITQKRCILLVIFFASLLFNFSLSYLQKYMVSLDSNILRDIANKFGECILRYNNPLVMIQSVSIFILFGTFKFKSKIINKVSSLTFGIYLIHENHYIRANIYKWIGLDTGSIIYGKSIILKVIILAILIFVVCAIIEWLRQLLFKFISKLKIMKKIDNKFMTWLSNLIEVK